MGKYERGRMEVLFPKFLDKVIREKNIEGKKLCQGICSISMLTRIRNGERIPNKMMRDRLLGRLGVDNRRWETFLNYDEYECWKVKEDILQYMESAFGDETMDYLQKYYLQGFFTQPLEQQFYHTCKGMILKQNGCLEEAVEEFKEALSYTVEIKNIADVRGLCMSVHELDIFLESIQLYLPGEKEKIYEIIWEKVEKDDADAALKGLFVPKLAYYMISCKMKNASEDMDWGLLSHMLKRCNIALRYDAKGARSIYLWELLDCKERILTKMIEACLGRQEKPDVFQKMHEETHSMKMAFEIVCQRTGIACRMKTDSYLYQQQNVYCLNDVLKHRREMLGMTVKELCAGICSEKTVSRLENKKCRVQAEVARKLFLRLGLPAEYYWFKFVSDDKGVLDAYSRYSRFLNEKNLQSLENDLQTLQNNLSMEIPVNRQVLQLVEMKHKLEKGLIDRKTAYEEAKKAFNCTMDLDKVVFSKDVYLTLIEQNCIQNMFSLADPENKKKYCDILRKVCLQYEKAFSLSVHLDMYIFLRTPIANWLGNEGMFAESDAISRKNIEEGLRGKYIYHMCQDIYCIAWNRKEQKNTESYEELLEYAYYFAKLCDRSFAVHFFEEKMAQISNNQ